MPPGGNGGLGVPRGDPRKGQDARIVLPKFLPWDLREGWEGWGLPWALAGARSPEPWTGPEGPLFTEAEPGLCAGASAEGDGDARNLLGCDLEGAGESLSHREPSRGAASAIALSPSMALPATACPSSARLGTKTRMLRGSRPAGPSQADSPTAASKGETPPFTQERRGGGASPRARNPALHPSGSLRHTWAASA